MFVIVPTTMPSAGIVTGIEYFNQATNGLSPNPSAGNLLHAYVLHATGTLNEFSVLWDSGELTVPAAIDPVGDAVTIPVPDVAVTTGDAIAFYGQGVPVDTGVGADLVSYPAATAPAEGGTIVYGDPTTFPILAEAREYSFGANVIDTSAVAPLVGATASRTAAWMPSCSTTPAAATPCRPSTSTCPTTRTASRPRDRRVPRGELRSGRRRRDGHDHRRRRRPVTAPATSAAPNVVIRDGTMFDPINTGASGAHGDATMLITSVAVDRLRQRLHHGSHGDDQRPDRDRRHGDGAPSIAGRRKRDHPEPPDLAT